MSGLVQLLVLTLAQGVERRIMAADQADELLWVHFMSMATGILMRHRRAVDIVGVRTGLLRVALI
ncbi:protein of unknown function [Bradyrhizobium vignae]|uniref:Uncharacterized protein n=1 Tax=Bradyrhizobium vignae TaxID=1549949 RepID=A0A2U3PSK8_9BRAD|nr:protein of unknown function [Bradyrhizobium vignae]